MFTAASCEPTIPKPTYSKRNPSSVVNQIDTTTLINNTSASTIASAVLDAPSTRVSSTIMGGSLTINNSTDQSSSSNNNNAMINPHESISIKNRAPVKSIRIERDYSLGDGITRFSTEYPAELSGKITPEQFQNTIIEINKIMDYADRLSWRIVMENIIETLTIYIWPIFFSTHYQRVVKRLLEFIETENTSVYYPQALSISDPVKTAFLFIEINFYE